MHALHLENMLASTSLEHPPTQLLHVPTPVIVVEDEHGPRLPLQLLIYDHGGQPSPDGPGEALTLLDVSYLPIPLNAPPTTVGAVRTILDRNCKSRKAMSSDVENYARRLGLDEPEVRFLEARTLLKQSSRIPEHTLAIRFHFFLVWPHGESGLRNLADPEGLRGWVYLPLDDLDSVIVRKRRMGCEEWWFRGRPLAPEVQYLLQPEHRPRLLEQPVKLRPEHFYRDEVGLILIADLAGWAVALQEARGMTAIGVDGPENVERLLASTSDTLYQFVDAIGPTYAQALGDGVLVAFPERLFDPEDVLARVMPGWRRLLGQVEAVNRYLRHRGITIGSRLVAHHGPYRYGRIGQARAHGAAVQGVSIVEATRLEQGLANFVRGQGGAGGGGWRHTLAVSDAALGAYPAALEGFTRHLEPAGGGLLRAKESALPAHLWKVGVEAP
jgi:hypothetical protein